MCGALIPLSMLSLKSKLPNPREKGSNFITPISPSKLPFICRSFKDMLGICRWGISIFAKMGPILSFPNFQLGRLKDTPGRCGSAGIPGRWKFGKEKLGRERSGKSPSKEILRFGFKRRSLQTHRRKCFVEKKPFDLWTGRSNRSIYRHKDY